MAKRTETVGDHWRHHRSSHRACFAALSRLAEHVGGEPAADGGIDADARLGVRWRCDLDDGHVGAAVQDVDLRRIHADSLAQERASLGRDDVCSVCKVRRGLGDELRALLGEEVYELVRPFDEVAVRRGPWQHLRFGVEPMLLKAARSFVREVAPRPHLLGRDAVVSRRAACDEGPFQRPVRRRARRRVRLEEPKIGSKKRFDKVADS
mmetsp:Transcript_32653/g.113013  ORF Transcript_32653/g.113013 Transcript_32653/m.113013 type:complete len:208 (+) Transcript_32653:53-676(+)